MAPKSSSNEYSLNNFLHGKSEHTLSLFHHFIEQYKQIGNITLHPANTMIGIGIPRKRIAYITLLGKNFIHVVFPFEKPFPDNLCFQKITQVPGDAKQFNHHFRILAKEDVNKEVISYIKLAYKLGS